MQIGCGTIATAATCLLERFDCAKAGDTVTGINASATATSIFFMTISFEGHSLAAFHRPST
jgi:hypothetical protein